MTDLAAAARAFAEAWADLLVGLPDDYKCRLTCEEAEAAADLLTAAGMDADAAAVVAAHAAYDEPGDTHYQGDRS